MTKPEFKPYLKLEMINLEINENKKAFETLCKALDDLPKPKPIMCKCMVEKREEEDLNE